MLSMATFELDMVLAGCFGDIFVDGTVSEVKENAWSQIVSIQNRLEIIYSCLYNNAFRNKANKNLEIRLPWKSHNHHMNGLEHLNLIEIHFKCHFTCWSIPHWHLNCWIKFPFRCHPIGRYSQHRPRDDHRLWLLALLRHLQQSCRGLSPPIHWKIKIWSWTIFKMPNPQRTCIYCSRFWTSSSGNLYNKDNILRARAFHLRPSLLSHIPQVDAQIEISTPWWK